jgi:hypothetical protein
MGFESAAGGRPAFVSREKEKKCGQREGAGCPVAGEEKKKFKGRAGCAVKGAEKKIQGRGGQPL